LVKNYEVGLFLDNGRQADTQVYKELMKGIQDKHIRHEAVFEGSSVEIGSNLNLSVFNPDTAGTSNDDRNDSSVVVKMEFSENSFLFTGDAEEGTEKDMILDEENLDVDWLKVGHHGSKSSSSEMFLKSVTPVHAVISVGKENRYGHPTQEALERLKSSGADVLRTDDKGTITVECSNPEEECKVR